MSQTYTTHITVVSEDGDLYFEREREVEATDPWDAAFFIAHELVREHAAQLNIRWPPSET